MRLLLPLSLLLLGGCSGINLVPRGAVDLQPVEQGLSISPRWVAEVGGGVGYRHTTIAPLLDGEQIYAADRHGNVYAFEAHSGKRLWAVDLKRATQVGIGDGGDSLLLGSDAQVIALNKKDGSQLWQRSVSSKLASRPKRIGGHVVVMTVGGALEVLDAADGRPQWKREEEVAALSLHGASAPVSSGERIFAGFANGRLRAFMLSDGELIWVAQVATARGRSELERMVDVDAGLQVGKGMVFAAAYQGQLAAYGLVNGSNYWSRKDLSVTNDLLLGDDALYVSDTNGTVWALSYRDGATLWRQEGLHKRNLSAPVLQGDYLVLGDYDGYLHWLDRRDGAIKARTRVQRLDERLALDVDDAYDNTYPEDRTLLVTPITGPDGWIYALDKRGVLEAYQVAPTTP